MIVETGDRFAVMAGGRCYGKYRLASRARQRLRQILTSQRTTPSKPRAVA
jgi:hypothetical protein